MQERVTILQHHVGVSLEPFLHDVDVSKVKEVILNEIFSRLEKFEIEGIHIYTFLSDAKLKQKFLEAFIKAGEAFVTNNHLTIPDTDECGKQNADIICQACGNFQNNQCLASQEPKQ